MPSSPSDDTRYTVFLDLADFLDRARNYSHITETDYLRSTRCLRLIFAAAPTLTASGATPPPTTAIRRIDLPRRPLDPPSSRPFGDDDGIAH